MNRRNWLDLSRKLVDRFDMDYSFSAITEFLGQQALSYFGEGVLPTKLYPNPFPINLDSGDMNGSVGTGVAYDPNGQLTEIATGTSTPTTFSVPNGDAHNPRWDLLVLRYVQTSQVLVPKPSDPIVSVYLNLVDDFQLAYLEGNPGGSPSYPAKGQLDIVLCGFKVPAGSTIGSQVTVDLSVRDIASALQVYEPLFKQERLAGVVNGVNTQFTTSLAPLSAASLLVFVDGILQTDLQWSFTGPNTVTLAQAPAIGQEVSAYYVVNDTSGVNPLMGAQEVPVGAPNGVNANFPLTGHPANQASTLVFVDGLPVDIAGWSLIQGAVSSIQFQSGSIPQAGQDVYVFYLTNTAPEGSSAPVTGATNVGSGTGLYISNLMSVLQIRTLKQGANMTFTIQPDGSLELSASGGGGGGGGYSSYGATTPITIQGFLGLTISPSDQRALYHVKSSGGAVPVTASPQISAGSTDGQELVLMGEDNANYPVFSDGNGLSLNGPCSVTKNQRLYLVWNALESVWDEISRRA